MTASYSRQSGTGPTSPVTIRARVHRSSARRPRPGMAGGEGFPRRLRVNAMESITFTIDYMGRRLSKPVSLLLADAGLVAARSGGELVCYVRDDAAGRWVKNVVTSRAPRAFNRTFRFHQDAVNGIDHVFAGTGAGEIYRGSYDPDASGWIRWEAEPEYANPDFEGGPSNAARDSASPTASCTPGLTRLLERPTDRSQRGAKCFAGSPNNVPGPACAHHRRTCSRRQPPGHSRLTRTGRPHSPHRSVEPLQGPLELGPTSSLTKRSASSEAANSWPTTVLSPATPLTGEPIHWVTVAGVKTGDIKAAWLMIRHTDGEYETVRVFDSELSNPPTLVSTRTLEFAPWSDREFYTGGSTAGQPSPEPQHGVDLQRHAAQSKATTMKSLRLTALYIVS